MELSIFKTILTYTSKQNIPIFENLKRNENVSVFEYLDCSNLDDNTYILSLRRKLMKPHIFLKKIPINIKTNA
jgi:hypothetical protein